LMAYLCPVTTDNEKRKPRHGRTPHHPLVLATSDSRQ
jgi:hypothetical protein